MKEEKAKEIIERLLPIQEQQEKGTEDILPCPRCGHYRMHRKLVRNAMSRYAHVYICELCGMDEAMRDMADKQLPLNEWGMVLGEE